MKKDTASKNKALFTGALEAPDSSREGDPTPATPTNYLESRSSALSKVASGNLILRSLHQVLPERCRLWVGHNRLYELLNEDRCRDLIEGIKAQNGQEFPAIVRAVKDDPNFEYEIICGARRHWAITWLRKHHYDFKYLIEVRDLSDEEAFRLSDIENRDREDISDYERAMDYKRALELYYSSQQDMADRIEVTKDWLSRFLQLADLPPEVVAAYRDVRDIKTNHMRGLSPTLKTEKLRAQLIQSAKAVADRQAALKAAAEEGMDGAAVLHALLVGFRVPTGGPKKTTTQLFSAKATGKTMLEATPKRGGLILNVSMSAKPTRDELVAAATVLIDQLFAAT